MLNRKKNINNLNNILVNDILINNINIFSEFFMAYKI